MATPKTVPTKASVSAFIKRVENDQRRADCEALVKIMKQITRAEPVMWGPSIVGFGSYHYTYASGREGDWPLTGFSPRKHALTLYIMAGFKRYAPLMKKLGKHSTGSSCLYIKRLEDVDLAAQQTDGVNYVVMVENPGFLVLYSAIKDALVRKYGAIKWWVEDHEKLSEREMSGLSDEEILDLLTDPEVEVDEDSLAYGEDETFTLTVRRRTTEKRYKIKAVPGEELAWNENASAPDFSDASIVVHTTEKRVHELVSMGFDQEKVEDAVERSQTKQESTEPAARQHDGLQPLEEEPLDPSMRLVRYDEAYVRIDPDGDGVRLFKVCMVGNHHAFLAKYPVDQIPIALFVFDPEPHEIIGLDIADSTMDVQLVKSMVRRGILDSLSLSLIPRTEVVEGMVNVRDLLNTEIGGIVRARAPNMMREIKHSFVGADALPVLMYEDEVKENRLGVSKAAAGLDADALQSSTKAAVAATISGAQQHIELAARILAETGMKTLYRGIAQMMREHQDKPKMIRLRNRWIETDPRAWNTNMDVVVNVALGAGTADERMQALVQILAKMEQTFASMGIQNPLVSLTKYRNALALATELTGFVNPDSFWNEITEEQEQQIAQQAAQAGAQQQPTDPVAMEVAKSEQMKVQLKAARDQAEIQLKQQELALQQREMELRDDRERDKQAADMILKLMEIEAKEKTSFELENIRAKVAVVRQALEKETRESVAEIQADAKPEGNA